VELRQVLSGYVELSQPATKRNLDILIEATMEAETKEKLKTMASTYKESILDRRVSVLDLLCTYSSLSIPLGTFLHMLPAMRVRQYSISSSPLWNPSHVTLTVSILNAPAISGSGEHFMGVGSTFLEDLQPGDLVQMVVRPSAAAFSLPVDSSIPLVLFCAGTGIAPMRGFIQERAIQVQSGRKLEQDVGKILLFFGCRDPEQDYLYTTDPEWKKWVEMGLVDVRPAFSRAPEKSEGCRYVQDRMLKDGDDVYLMYQQKAKVSIRNYVLLSSSFIDPLPFSVLHMWSICCGYWHQGSRNHADVQITFARGGRRGVRETAKGALCYRHIWVRPYSLALAGSTQEFIDRHPPVKVTQQLYLFYASKHNRRMKMFFGAFCLYRIQIYDLTYNNSRSIGRD
jgi:hypothetical protein